MKYRLLKEARIEEMHGDVRLLEHERSGARVLTVKNHDKNKVFMIAFRTTPEDSTGVAHIMEHSVLCGSRKYPIRDPFVELAKGSLNTFLNAMTYPDKTVYPIASVNDKDFMNLCDVYLDSVFYPRVYTEPKIFRQEGWHYEVDGFGTDSEEISVNGVVYNEMKGAFSNPDQVLERFTLNSLFPDTTYAHESGGAPEAIPDLSFDKFLDFHRRYYHPSNSYIYLYGDMDMDEKLDWLDDNYLSAFGRITPLSEVTPQAPYSEPRECTAYYAVSDNEDAAGKAFLSENYCIPGEPGRESALSWQILDYILLNSPGAVLREALVKAGICEDVEGGWTGEVRQPYFSIIARNADESRAEAFTEIIHNTLEELCLSGISKKSLGAALNYIEFKCREEDFGTFPMGLAEGLRVLSSWIYDRDPFEFLYYNDAFKSLREKIGTDYFEELIRKALLDNGFKARVNILPEKGLTERNDEKRKEKMRKFRESLSAEQIKAIKAESDELKAYQNETESPEALKCLPVLNISDIDPAAEKNLAVRDGDIIYSGADSSGIAYISILFDTEGFSEEEISLASFLSDVLGEVSTSRHSYADLFDEVMLTTGGIGFKLASYAVDGGGYRGVFRIDMRVFDDRIGEGLGLVSEMINESCLGDTQRIGEILNRVRTQQKAALEGALHKAAVTRAASYISDMRRFDDLAGGIAYYDFIRGAAQFAGSSVHIKRFIRSLKAVSVKLFSVERLDFALYGSSRAKETLKSLIGGFGKELAAAKKAKEDDLVKDLASAGFSVRGRGEGAGGLSNDEILKAGGAAALVPVSSRGVMRLSNLNEGLGTSSEVNYDAVCGDFGARGLKYRGGLEVLRVMLSYDYLWIRIRVLGGAYGCMAGFARSGLMYLTSYRDPEIAGTYEVYDELPEYLANWQGDEDTVRKYIIGAIAALDHPVTHSIRAADELANYIYGLTDEMRQQKRDEILSVKAADIRSFAEYVRALLDSGAKCTIGNSAAINKDNELFKSVRGLF